MIFKDVSQKANEVPTIEISTITDELKAMTTNEPTTGKQTINDMYDILIILKLDYFRTKCQGNARTRN